jgi:hypothetical protein
MGLERFCRQDGLHDGHTHAEVLGEGSNAPVGSHRYGGRTAGSGGDPMANGSIIFPFAPSAGLVHQARQAVGSKASPPFNDHGLGHLQHLLDLFVPLALGRQQHDAGAQNIPLGGGGRAHKGFAKSFALQKLTRSAVLDAASPRTISHSQQ